MISKSRLIPAIFLIIPTFMALMSFVVNFINKNKPILSHNTLLLAGVFIGMGLILSAIVFLVVSFMIKQPSAKAEEPSISEGTGLLFDEKVAQVLAILQKKGRFIDFLQEDISVFDDKQIGSAVRNIHKSCKEAVMEYVTIEPVMKEQEGAEITVDQQFDPSTIRLAGNVVGKPPFKGILRHCGWRVLTTKMPDLPRSQDLSIIEPAEVEIS